MRRGGLPGEVELGLGGLVGWGCAPVLVELWRTPLPIPRRRVSPTEMLKAAAPRTEEQRGIGGRSRRLRHPRAGRILALFSHTAASLIHNNKLAASLNRVDQTCHPTPFISLPSTCLRYLIVFGERNSGRNRARKESNQQTAPRSTSIVSAA